MKTIALLTLVFTLTACSTSVQNTISDPAKNNGTLTDSQKTSETTPASEQPGISMESVEKISNLEDLKAINPFLANMSGSENPNFLELQKANMQMGILLTNLKSPEYAELLEKQNAIYQGRALWTPEVTGIHDAFMELLKNPPKTADAAEVIKKAALQQIESFEKIQASKEYQDYIFSNQASLTEISTAIQKLYTPEMKALQEKIQKLTTTVYPPQNSGAVTQ